MAYCLLVYEYRILFSSIDFSSTTRTTRDRFAEKLVFTIFVPSPQAGIFWHNDNGRHFRLRGTPSGVANCNVQACRATTKPAQLDFCEA